MENGKEQGMRDMINKLNKIETNDDLVLNEEVVALITDPNVKYTTLGFTKLGKDVTDSDIKRQISEMLDNAWGPLD